MIEYEGDHYQNFREGKGSMFSNNQKIYEGQIVKDNREGFGKSFYKFNIIKYKGNWKNNKMHGDGQLFSEDNVQIYEGSFVNDKKEGLGTTYNFQGKIQYKGNFKNDMFHGKGLLYFSNSENATNTILDIQKQPDIEFDGEFYQNKKQGFGVLFFTNGNIAYQGSFWNNSFSGEGTSYFKNGKVNYDGYWLNGSRQGYGVAWRIQTSWNAETNTQNYNDTTHSIVYEGNWAYDVCHGDGISYYEGTNNKEYEGIFQKNKRHLQGTLYFNNDCNSKIYEGEFYNDQKQGKGIKFDLVMENKIYEGEYYKNKRNGLGLIYFDNNFKLLCCWNMNYIDKVILEKDDLFDTLNNQVEDHSYQDLNDCDIIYYDKIFKGIVKAIYYDETVFVGEVQIKKKKQKSYEPCGKGILFKKKYGTKVYEGNFKDGKTCGFGKAYYGFKDIGNTIRYIGEWKQNLRTGHGVSYYNNGKKSVQGYWLEGKISYNFEEEDSKKKSKFLNELKKKYSKQFYIKYDQYGCIEVVNDTYSDL